MLRAQLYFNLVYWRFTKVSPSPSHSLSSLPLSLSLSLSKEWMECCHHSAMTRITMGGYHDNNLSFDRDPTNNSPTLYQNQHGIFKVFQLMLADGTPTLMSIADKHFVMQHPAWEATIW